MSTFERSLGLCFTLVATLGCSHLVYQPSKNVIDSPRETPDDIWFQTEDGVELHGWWFQAKGEHRGSVIQFHGNAGNITSHFAQLDWVTAHGYDFFTFDWRGYGRSEGSPTQAGLLADARAALRVARERSVHAKRPDLVLFGQSLGGAVLLRVLGAERDRSNVRSVIVEGSFHSYRDAGAGVLWRSPAAPFAGLAYTLVSDDESPARYIERISPTPLLVIHDQHDPIVGFEFGLAIHRAAREPKDFWPLETGGHLTSAKEPGFRQALLEWFDDPRPVRRVDKKRMGATRAPISLEPPKALQPRFVQDSAWSFLSTRMTEELISTSLD